MLEACACSVMPSLSPLTNQATKSPTNAQPLSERPVGYLLALIGGFLALPTGIILSPLALFSLNKLMVMKDDKRPNRFSRWVLIGCVAVPVNLALLITFGNKVIESNVAACNAGATATCRKLLDSENFYSKITNPAFPAILKEHEAMKEKERLAELKRKKMEKEQAEAAEMRKAEARKAKQQQEAETREAARLRDAQAKVQERLTKQGAEARQREQKREGIIAIPIAKGSAPSSNPVEEKAVATMSFVQCRSHVKDRLKSPSTAKFPLLDFTAIKGADDTYMVMSYVDAQNSFGAMLRSSFMCSIKRVSKDGDIADPRSWELKDLLIQ